MDLERFGRLVYERRTELGLSQEEVAERGGPTDTTIGKIENAEWTPGNRWATFRKLDIGLRWVAGSAKRALDGGDPLPIETLEPREQAIHESAADHVSMVDMRVEVNARWNVALDLAEQVLALPAPPLELRGVAFEAVKMIGDLLTAEVLQSNQAKNAKEILDRLYETRFQARQRLLPEGKRSALPTDQTTQSDASTEAGEDEEAALLKKPEVTPGGAALGDATSDFAGSLRAEIEDRDEGG